MVQFAFLLILLRQRYHVYVLLNLLQFVLLIQLRLAMRGPASLQLLLGRLSIVVGSEHLSKGIIRLQLVVLKLRIPRLSCLVIVIWVKHGLPEAI